MPQMTPENVFVFFAFEAILSGLLAMVLVRIFLKNPALRRETSIICLFGALSLLSFAYFLCSFLNFYAFYFQTSLVTQEPENFAFPLFYVSVLLLGAAFNRPTNWFSPAGIALSIGAVLGIVDVGLHLVLGVEHPSTHWLLAGLLLLVFLLMLQRKVHPKQGRMLLSAAYAGLAASFFLLYWSYSGKGPFSKETLWLWQQVAVVGSLIALAYVIELQSEELFTRFFIRLNLTFVILAGFIIVIVAGVQRREYLDFANRQAADLVEFLRGHVIYFHSHGEDDRRVLSRPELTRRIVADFGKIPVLKSVAIRFHDLRFALSIDERGIVSRTIVKAPEGGRPQPMGAILAGKKLHLISPIFEGGNRDGSVELTESVASMNQRIARQVMIIFSAFTVMVMISAILIGLIVSQGDATIRRQYEELEETHRQLLQAARLAAVGEMAGGVAHEINNPLGVILGRSDYLLAVSNEQGAGEIREDLEVIQRNASRAARIIRDLLDFARPHVLNRKENDLNKIVVETVELLSPRLGERHVALCKNLKPMPQIELDRDRIQQVLVNLINNAIDACQPQSGAVVIQSRVDTEGKWAIVEIEDNGCGISQENQKKVFDPFFTTKHQGTGLGLSISYRIIRDHGGHIDVSSQTDNGARFAIYLPVSDAKERT